MPLVKDVLKKNILDALEEAFKISGPSATPPFAILPKVASLLADAYDKYALSAMAPPMTAMVSKPVKSGLETALVAPMMAGWVPGLLAYWSPVTWTGAGFIPVNPTIPLALLGLAPEIVLLVGSPSKPDSIEVFADKLSTLLHSYTTKLLVTTTTTSAPPVVAVAKVS